MNSILFTGRVTPLATTLRLAGIPLPGHLCRRRAGLGYGNPLASFEQVADDTAAIQAAIDAANTYGGRVYLPAGDYRVTSSLVFYTHTAHASYHVRVPRFHITRPVLVWTPRTASDWL